MPQLNDFEIGSRHTICQVLSLSVLPHVILLPDASRAMSPTLLSPSSDSLFGQTPYSLPPKVAEGRRRDRAADHHCSAATFWVSPSLSQINRFTASRRHT